MTPKDTLLQAMELKETERVPVSLFGGGMWSIKDYGTSFEELATNPRKMSDMLVAESAKLLCDIVYAGSGYNNFHAQAFGGGIKYRQMGAPDLTEHLVHGEEVLANFDFASLDNHEVIGNVVKALNSAKEAINGEYAITMTAWGPFTLAARFVGEEDMMKATFKRKDFVHKTVNWVTDLLIHLYTPLVDSGSLDLISLADPTASGDLISKRQFEQYAVPYLRKFTDWAKSRNMPTLVHICGNTTDRLDAMPNTGASCISLDHKTDIVKAREVLGGKMCFAGNVDPVAVMLNGTAEQVEAACSKVIETAGTGGGFILMPGCDIPPTVPYENIQTFIRTARQWKL